MKSTKSAAKLAAQKPVQKTPRSSTLPEAPASGTTAQPPIIPAASTPPTTSVPVAKPAITTTAPSAPAPAKPAPAPVPMASTPTKSTPASKSSPATIEVKTDVGFGNTLYLRGQGAGLSWEKGIPLTCVDAKTWRWTGEIKTPVTFKLLVNDNVWASGSDLTIAPGQKIEITPSFA